MSLSSQPSALSTPAAIEAAYAPKIAAALSAERSQRDAAFLDAPFVIGDIPLRAMTLPDYLLLIDAGNAHVVSQPVPAEPGDAMSFWCAHHAAVLWLLSPDFLPHAPAARETFVLRRVAPLDYLDLTDRIAEYFRETFDDAPSPGAPDGQHRSDPFRVSFAAHWLREVAEIVPWSRAELRALPLKEFFQYLRLSRVEAQLKNGKHPRGARDSSDRLWAEMLAQLNALNVPAS